MPPRLFSRTRAGCELDECAQCDHVEHSSRTPVICLPVQPTPERLSAHEHPLYINHNRSRPAFITKIPIMSKQKYLQRIPTSFSAFMGSHSVTLYLFLSLSLGDAQRRVRSLMLAASIEGGGAPRPGKRALRRRQPFFGVSSVHNVWTRAIRLRALLVWVASGQWRA
jgi:hypothetical protein